jgi:branched-chain amino acid transport system ATP-binding protein
LNQQHPGPLLSVAALSVRFGGITALDGVSLQVNRGEICGLIGPNGAGKTTLFNCASRIHDPVAGDILYKGTSLLQVPPHGVAALGIARTFQNLALFDRLSVLDNVLVGGHVRGRSGFLRDVLRGAGTLAEDRELRSRARYWLAFVGLDTVMDAPVTSLPFGSRRRVELARALMAEPQLLLLDEPAAGTAAEEVRALEQLVCDARDRLGITILLVEHRMGLVMSLCDHVVVLEFGRVIADGDPATVAADPAVIEAYLGAGV